MSVRLSHPTLNVSQDVEADSVDAWVRAGWVLPVEPEVEQVLDVADESSDDEAENTIGGYYYSYYSDGPDFLS